MNIYINPLSDKGGHVQVAEARMRGLALRAAQVQIACASALKRAGVERF